MVEAVVMGVDRNEHRKVPSTPDGAGEAPPVSKELVEWLEVRINFTFPTSADAVAQTVDEALGVNTRMAFHCGRLALLATLKALSERTPS